MKQCTKEDRPAGGAARRSGFWACAENDCKSIIANSCRIVRIMASQRLLLSATTPSISRKTPLKAVPASLTMPSAIPRIRKNDGQGHARVRSGNANPPL